MIFGEGAFAVEACADGRFEQFRQGAQFFPGFGIMDTMTELANDYSYEKYY